MILQDSSLQPQTDLQQIDFKTLIKDYDFSDQTNQLQVTYDKNIAKSWSSRLLPDQLTLGLGPMVQFEVT